MLIEKFRVILEYGRGILYALHIIITYVIVFTYTVYMYVNLNILARIFLLQSTAQIGT